MTRGRNKEPVEELDNPTNLDKVCKVFKERVRADWDLAIAITGEEGVGKSTVGMQMARRIDENFDLGRNLLFSPTKEEMEDKVKELPKYSVIDADEAMKILYKLDWHKNIQKKLNKIYALCRKENLVSIFCIPRFNDLNEYFRNHRIKVWIHVIERSENYARAVVMFKDTNPFQDDPWHIKRIKKVIKKKKKYRKNTFFALDVKEQIKLFKKSPAFYKVITVKPLPKEMRKKYEKLRDKEKYKNLLEGEGEELNKNDKRWRKRVMHAWKFLDGIFGDVVKQQDLNRIFDPDAQVYDGIKQAKGTFEKVPKVEDMGAIGDLVNDIREDIEKDVGGTNNKTSDISNSASPHTNNPNMYKSIALQNLREISEKEE